MRPWICVAYSAPVATASAVFLLYPFGQGRELHTWADRPQPCRTGMEVMHERLLITSPLTWLLLRPHLWLFRHLPSVDLESNFGSDQLNQKAPFFR